MSYLLYFCLVTKPQENNSVSHTFPDSSCFCYSPLHDFNKHIPLGELPVSLKIVACALATGVTDRTGQEQLRMKETKSERKSLALLRGHSFLTSHCSNNELHEYFKISSLSCWWPWPTHSRVQTIWFWNSLNYFPTCGWSQENKGIHFLKRHLLIVKILYFLNFLNLNAQVGIFWDKPFLGTHWDHLWSNDLHPMEPVWQFDNADPSTVATWALVSRSAVFLVYNSFWLCGGD